MITADNIGTITFDIAYIAIIFLILFPACTIMGTKKVSTPSSKILFAVLCLTLFLLDLFRFTSSNGDNWLALILAIGWFAMTAISVLRAASQME